MKRKIQQYGLTNGKSAMEIFTHLLEKNTTSKFDKKKQERSKFKNTKVSM